MNEQRRQAGVTPETAKGKRPPTPKGKGVFERGRSLSVGSCNFGGIFWGHVRFCDIEKPMMTVC